MDLGFKGKVAMVAGASKGLGFAVAQILASEGAIVSMSSRDGAAIEAAAGRIRQSAAADVFGVAADLSTAVGIERWGRSTVERFGGVDVLFANTGGPPAGVFLSIQDQVWQSSFELLVLSAVRLSRFVIPIMKSRGQGSILFSTSSSVKEPISNLTLSNVLRGSVSALAKTLALELAADRIRVNHIIPGRIDTDRLRQLNEINAQKAGITTEELRRRSESTIPLGRFGKPDEFANAAAFLLSNRASYITGATLQVDGGVIRSVV